MQTQIYIKNVSISPKKLRFILDDVKKHGPARALHMLKYGTNRPSKLLYTALQSALANAKNHLKIEEDLLQFRAIIIEQGQVLKRFRPGGRGTAKPYKRKYSHIKIVLGVKEEKKELKQEAKALLAATKNENIKTTHSASSGQENENKKLKTKAVKNK